LTSAIAEDDMLYLAPLLTLAGCAAGYLLPAELFPDTGSDAEVGDLQVPSELDLGWVVVGQTGTGTLTLTNGGRANLVLTDLAQSGDAGGPVVTVPEAFDAGDYLLAAGDAVDLAVTFAPTAEGCLSTTLTISSDDPDQPQVDVPITGCGTDGLDASLFLNVDDAWEAWLDGTSFSARGADDYSSVEQVVWKIAPGAHLLAVRGQDTSGWAGLIGGVLMGQDALTLSGDGAWVSTAEDPGEGWEQRSFDDSTWTEAIPCADAAWGRGSSGPLLDLGALWVWSKADYQADGEDTGWFRVTFTVPEPE